MHPRKLQTRSTLNLQYLMRFSIVNQILLVWSAGVGFLTGGARQNSLRCEKCFNIGNVQLLWDLSLVTNCSQPARGRRQEYAREREGSLPLEQ